jgi:hypothetical protein
MRHKNNALAAFRHQKLAETSRIIFFIALSHNFSGQDRHKVPKLLWLELPSHQNSDYAFKNFCQRCLCPCLLVRISLSMSPCPCLPVHVSLSMSPCLQVSMSHVYVSMFPFLHLHVSMFPKFHKRKKEVTKIGNFPLFASNGKWKRQTSLCLL